MDIAPTVERMIRKFEARAPLDDRDRAALRALPFEKRLVAAGGYIVREGSMPKVSCLLLAGLAFRQKMTVEGDRQIVSVHVAGDFVDLEGSLVKLADHSVQALTGVQIATVPVHRVVELIDSHPRVARAMWIDTLIDASIYREWVMNVGRRPARQRIGHLLCEFACRLETSGLGMATGYLFPMTQEQLADAVGLTSVHVNRTLKLLEEDGLIRRHKRFIEIPDWERLRSVSGFNELYLHLDQAAGDGPRGTTPPTLAVVQ